MTTTTTLPPSTSAAPAFELAPDAHSNSYPSFALIGRAGSGKTTGAEFLARHYGYVMMSFAKPLKDIAESLWGAGKRNDREKLQKLGVAVREIEDSTWVNVLMRSLEVAQRVGPVVVDDCRFENEYWALRERGFVSVRIEAFEDQRVDRLIRSGKLQDRSQLNHVSEISLDDIDPDYAIRNTRGPLDYEGELVDVLNRELRKS